MELQNNDQVDATLLTNKELLSATIGYPGNINKLYVVRTLLGNLSALEF